jgi:ubiquinone/menaquinone biosynthesis C-methylase UbiE
MSHEPDTARSAYERWHKRFPVDAGSDTPWHTLLKRHLDVPRDVRDRLLLEIGSGRGGLATWLAEHASQPRAVVAADFAASAVRMGRDHADETGVARLTWEVADIQTLPHADESFDTVISCETIEHVPDPGTAVRELARVLKQGGRLLLTTPNYLGTMGAYRLYLRLTGRRYTEEGQPINHLTLLPRTRRWVVRAGLRIVRTDGIGHYLPLPGAPPRPLRWPDRAPLLAKWFALHSITIAEKP